MREPKIVFKGRTLSGGATGEIPVSGGVPGATPPATAIPPPRLAPAPALRLPGPKDPSRPADLLLALAVTALTALGVVMVYSASALGAASSVGDPEYLLHRHVMHLAVGATLFTIALLADHRRLKRWVYPLLGVALAVLILVLIPGVGFKVGGARRWLLGGSFQPSEAAKLALIVYLAYSLSNKRESIKTFSIGFLPHALVAGVMVGLVLLEPDLGTAVILALVTGVMLFIGGARVSYLAFAAVAASPVVYHLIMNVGWRLNRLMAFLEPEAHRSDHGYQLWESLIAIGSGGLTGLGLGAGKQKLFYVPEAETDFIFAVIGEELGLIGAVATAGCFAILVWRGTAIALRSQDDFSRLLASGLTTLIGVQAAFNMLVVVGMLPTKGLTLPFVSYGGSSLCATLTAAGLLLNISMRTPDPFAPPAAARRKAASGRRKAIGGTPIEVGSGRVRIGAASLSGDAV